MENLTQAEKVDLFAETLRQEVAQLRKWKSSWRDLRTINKSITHKLAFEMIDKQVSERASEIENLLAENHLLNLFQEDSHDHANHKI